MSGELAAGGSAGMKATPETSAGRTATTPCEVNGGPMRGTEEGGRPAIRPVRVDEAGRIFEMSGERIVMPGLAPENILKGIEDERAGRLQSFDEYLASRNPHGI